MATPDTTMPANTAPGRDWLGQDAPGRQATLTAILAQVSREALQGEGLDAVMQGIVDCLARQLPVAIASILLIDADAGMFVQEVWAGEIGLDSPPGAPGGGPWPVSIGAAGRCVRTGEAQLLPDVALDPDYVPGNRAVKSEYLVPIRHRGRLHGVLNLESTRQDFFTPEACGVFDAVAAQVGGALHLARVVAELEVANQLLQRQSLLDGLTGIANRRCFDQALDTAWRDLAAQGRPLALLLVDADCFKPLNDALGHLHGDDCLRKLARLCSEEAGPGELVARVGGEEFALLLPGLEGRAARQRAERLRRRVEAAAMPHPRSAAAAVVTISIGVASQVPVAGDPPAALLHAADRGLYAAKAKGRNAVVLRRTGRPGGRPSRGMR